MAQDSPNRILEVCTEIKRTMSNTCDIGGKITGIVFIKKGMAMKAFVNNVKTGNTKKIEKQIKKGTVKTRLS